MLINRIHELWYTHAMEYYLSIKTNYIYMQQYT